MNLTLPSKTIDFTIQDKEYTVKFPNNEKYIEIEVMKSKLTDKEYNSISNGNTNSSQIAKYTVDMIAFFTVCCPKLKEDLTISSFSELDVLENKKFLNVYVKVILPWLLEWDKVINSIDEEDKEDKK